MDQVCSVCNTTKRFNVLSEPILESNLEFLNLIKEANLILKGHHSCTELETFAYFTFLLKFEIGSYIMDM
ncbi:hypothetical protein HKD37_19G052469 [Glycine soja]